MIRCRCRRLGIFVAVLWVAMSAFAFAADKVKEKDLGGFGVWRSYQHDEGGQTVCYMVTAKLPLNAPVDSKASKKKVRTPYLMITHRPVEASTDVFSYGAGASLDTKHSVTIHIAKDDFDLFAVRDTAWARDALTDHKIAKAIRGNATAKVSGILGDNQAAAFNDKFPLTGALEAYRAINKACGLADVEGKKEASGKPVAKKAGEVLKDSSVKKSSIKGKKASEDKVIQKKKTSSKPKVQEVKLPVKSVKKTETTKKTGAKKPLATKPAVPKTTKPE